MKKTKIVIALVLLISLLFSPYITKVIAAKEESGTNIQLYAQSAVLMDADSGRLLFGKNPDQIMPMASTTKIMTCIVALENGNMSDVVTVSAYAARQPKVHLGMREGQQFVLKDLLYSLMLESHNDSAVAIAEHIGQSAEGFASLMNQKAKDIGCFDTFFITPNGLDATAVDREGNTRVHATTARDLAKIMKYCFTQSEKKKEFLTITQTPNYSFMDAEGKRSYAASNHNAFLNMMDGAVTGKTGFTNNAGYCYVGALERDKKSFVVALLACGWPSNKAYKWSDTKKLMAYGLDSYEYRDLYEPVTLKSMQVMGGIPEEQTPFKKAFVTVGLQEEAKKKLPMLVKEGEKVEIKINLKKKLQAPLPKGSVTGYVRYYLEDMLLKEYPIVTKKNVNVIHYRWILQYVTNLYLL